jgi:large subunit ribosomal protein L25
MLALEITARAKGKSAENLRKAGVVPGVFYGPKEGSVAISIEARKLERVWKEAGATTVITLKGIGEDKDTLIHDVQFHPVTGALLHADFYVLEKGKKITINIPLEFEGAAPAEKAGHIITKVMHEVEIEVAPQELPQHLNVDLSKLENVGDHVLVSDIKLPPSATLVTNADEIVASVTEFVEEKAEITPAPETEILTAKPAAEGEEGAAPAPAKEKKD